MYPGAGETEQRIFLETVAPPPAPKGEGEEGEGEQAEPEEPEKIFEDSQTYIHLRVELSEPINPYLVEPTRKRKKKRRRVAPDAEATEEAKKEDEEEAPGEGAPEGDEAPREGTLSPEEEEK